LNPTHKTRPAKLGWLRALLEAILAGFLIVLLSPLLVALALAIVISDRHSPLFRQDRVGKNGKLFKILKFRTMKVTANPYMLKPEDSDPVVTRVGHVVRGRAMDELPQLWNVMKGQMAFVGPRPEMAFIVETYNDTERLRLTAKPGLTGLWQLSRVRDRAIHHNIEYDLFYIFNRSLLFDLWLLWRTGLFALFGKATKIRVTAKMWDRNPAWRRYVPARSRAIPIRSKHRRTEMLAAAILAGLFVLGVPGIVMAFLAKGDLENGRAAMLLARNAARRLEPQAVATALKDARSSFNAAEGKLGSWLGATARLVPLLSQNLKAAHSLAAAGQDLVAAGENGLAVLDKLPKAGTGLGASFHNGGLALAPFSNAAPMAVEMRRHVIEAQKKVADSPSSLLIPAVARARFAVEELLTKARHEADVAAGATFLIPRVFGGESARTWALGAENNAELRGRGGYLGSFGLLSANRGLLSMGSFQATDELPALPEDLADKTEIPAEYSEHYLQLGALAAWQNLLMSPNFSSGAKLFLSQLKATAGISAGGLISIDPIGLSYLLDLAGPVQVPGIPEPLTASNLTDWSLNKIYFAYQNDNAERRKQLAQMAGLIWQKVISTEGLDPRRLAAAFGRAAAERHLVLYSARPDEQRLFEALGLSGNVKGATGDYLLLTGQNTSENKMDYYIKRKMAYRGSVNADGSMAATLQISATNTAAVGAAFPGYVGGANPRLGLGVGRARQFLSVFVPKRAQLLSVFRDGVRTEDYSNDTEVGKRRFSAYMELGPQESQTLTFRYRLQKAVQRGTYRLLVQNQATVTPDELSVDIELPKGASVTTKKGFIRGNGLRWKGPVAARIDLAAGLHRPLSDRLMARLAGWLKHPVISLSSEAPGRPESIAIHQTTLPNG